MVFCYFDDGMKRKNTRDKHIFSFYSNLPYNINFLSELIGRASG